MRTSIKISGLQSYAHHGMFEEERRLGQKFSFDVLARLSAGGSHLGDTLASSVRYDALVSETLRVAHGATFQTLEALAEAVARALLERFAAMEGVTVGVAKLSPPMAESLQRVGVQVELARAELEALHA